jgi:hypothetical protein
MTSVTPRKGARLASYPEAVTPQEKKAERDRRRRRKLAEQAEADEREKKATLAAKDEYIAHLRREIAKLESALKDARVNHSAAGDSDAESRDAGRRKKRFFGDDVSVDDDEDLKPAYGESDDYEDDDANISDDGIKRVFDEAAGSSLLFRRLTGLELTEFTELFGRASQYITSTSNEGKPLKTRPHIGVWRIQPSLQLFFTVVWLRLYLPHWAMAFFFHVPVRYVPKILKRCVPALRRTFRKMPFLEGGMPTGDDIRAIVQKEAPMQIGGVKMHSAFDGMHWPIRSRKKTKDMTDEDHDAVDAWIKKMKNAKHQVLATNLLVLVSVSGHLLKYWGPHLGGTEAVQLRDHCDLPDFLKKHGLSVVADAGLCVNSQTRQGARAFFSVGPKLVQLSKFVLKHSEKFKKEQVAYFQKVYDSTRIASRIRIIVENWIGAARTWRVMRDVWRGFVGDAKDAPLYGVTQDDVVEAVFFLLNTRLLKRPLRGADWRPDVKQLPAGVKYGYPGNHFNARTLEIEAALQFVLKPARGRASLSAAFEKAKEIVEGEKSKGRQAKTVVADDKSSLSETSSDDAVDAFEDANSEDDDDGDRSVEGLVVKSQGAFLRQLTKEGARKDTEAKKAATSSTAETKKSGKKRRTKEASDSAGD